MFAAARNALAVVGLLAVLGAGVLTVGFYLHVPVGPLYERSHRECMLDSWLKGATDGVATKLCDEAFRDGALGIWSGQTAYDPSAFAPGPAEHTLVPQQPATGPEPGE